MIVLVYEFYWKMYVFLIILKVLQFCNCKLVFRDDKTKLESCIFSIVNKYNVEKIVIASDNNITTKFEDNFTVTNLYLSDDLRLVSSLGMHNFYVIKSKNLSHVDAFLGQVRKSVSWSCEVKVLVLHSMPQHIGNVFELMWKYHIVNAILVTETFDVYTYYPITVGKCNDPRPFLLGKCERFEARHESATQYFHSCKFKMLFIHFPPWSINWKERNPGMALKVQQEIASVLDIDLIGEEYPHDKLSLLLPNGTYTGFFADILQGQADLVLAPQIEAYLLNFDLVPLFYPAVLYFYVPMAGKNKEWVNIMLVFSSTVWLMVFTSIFLVLSLCYVLTFTESGKFNSYKYAAFVVWKILFTPNVSTPRRCRFKLFLMAWTFLAFLITSAYNGFLSSTLFLPHYDNQINSVDKLLASDLSWGGTYIVQYVLEAVNTPKTKKICKQYVLCPGVSMLCVERAAESQNFATLHDRESVAYHWENYLDQNGRPKLYGFASNLHIDIVFFARKGHPVSKRMTEVVYKFFEYGLLSKWNVYDKIGNFLTVETKFKKITITHLFIAFALLIIGIFAAFCAFALNYGVENNNTTFCQFLID